MCGTSPNKPIKDMDIGEICREQRMLEDEARAHLEKNNPRYRKLLQAREEFSKRIGKVTFSDEVSS